MPEKTVWCWRLHIKFNDTEDDEEDFPIVEIIDINDYTEAVINDLYAYYNWIFDEYRWWIDDIDLVELPVREVSIPRWADFIERYGDGSKLHIDYWDWKKHT